MTHTMFTSATRSNCESAQPFFLHSFLHEEMIALEAVRDIFQTYWVFIIIKGLYLLKSEMFGQPLLTVIQLDKGQRPGGEERNFFFKLLR